MKMLFAAGVLIALAGCATAPAPGNLRESDLRQSAFLRGEQKFNSTFAQVQRNLFKNQELCDIDFVWRLDENQISYGTILYKAEADADLSQSVLIDITSYSNGNIVAKAYTYYADARANARNALNVLTDPTICPPNS
ncbi:hypothetical protein L1889_01830 [Paenalcaligenes niemegkensis]|uniref:hypothetical protein n=1 Tax=Paenalcaligenes niemegkensis TaxID=2895469 RepID=UPI001EE7D6DD|nr:hypothetical protein [Paenalcaligenes niemegkensis]MCQ9615613.1 hypothetical protein [Paenalcaligenes niemegkensis]